MLLRCKRIRKANDCFDKNLGRVLFGGCMARNLHHHQIRTNSFNLLSRNRVETEMLGRKIASMCLPGDIISLQGEMGSGKTVFAKGFIQAATQNFAAIVQSPTYLLEKMYLSTDGTRLDSSQDLYRIGIPHILEKDICLIEWGNKLDPSLIPTPQQHLTIQIMYVWELDTKEKDNLSQMIQVAGGHESACGEDEEDAVQEERLIKITYMNGCDNTKENRREESENLEIRKQVGWDYRLKQEGYLLNGQIYTMLKFKN